MNAAIFLDRDGVLVEDMHLLVSAEQLRVLPGVPEALQLLRNAGFRLVVVTNQTVVARGLATENDVKEIHARLIERIVSVQSPPLDAFYFCPHHPRATLPAYREDCDCRKPRPGLLLRAARELNLDLRESFMVGDRITDIIAGARADCRTILVQTGRHLENPIETAEQLDTIIKPDYVCADLAAATEWILNQSKKVK